MKADLKALLIKLINRRCNSWSQCTGSSSNLTTTSTRDLITTTYTSNTGRIHFQGFTNRLYTSVKTSGLRVNVNGSNYGQSGTNLQTTTGSSITTFGYVDVPIGTSITIKLQMYAQDATTTATIPAYSGYGLSIQDII